MSHKAEKKNRAETRREYWRVRRRVSKLLPKERVADCHKYPVPKKNFIERLGDRPAVHICIHKETKNAFFSNLRSCGSVWACLFCAVKITEKRKAELLKLKEKIKDTSIVPYMLTLTFRHCKGDRLADLIKAFFNALDKYFFNRQFWREYKIKIGLLHFIKVLEVNHGANGWHLHLHMLLLVSSVDLDTGEIRLAPSESEILQEWQWACESGGLGVPDAHGVKISSHEAISTYIAKWGLESELTKQHTKKGKSGNLSPFDLARKCELENDSRAGELFQEYYRSFKGRRQMVKSRGFNAFFELEKEKSDTEIANESVEDSILVGKISYDDYNLVKWHEAEPEVLEAAELAGMVGVWDVINSLRLFVAPFLEGMLPVPAT